MAGSNGRSIAFEDLLDLADISRFYLAVMHGNGVATATRHFESMVRSSDPIEHPAALLHQLAQLREPHFTSHRISQSAHDITQYSLRYTNNQRATSLAELATALGQSSDSTPSRSS